MGATPPPPPSCSGDSFAGTQHTVPKAHTSQELTSVNSHTLSTPFSPAPRSRQEPRQHPGPPRTPSEQTLHPRVTTDPQTGLVWFWISHERKPPVCVHGTWLLLPPVMFSRLMHARWCPILARIHSPAPGIARSTDADTCKVPFIQL